MTYMDIYNWAKEKLAEEQKHKKVTQCSLPSLCPFLKTPTTINCCAEKELIAECCPNASMLPTTEISLFNMEDLIKLKNLIKNINQNLRDIKDKAGELCYKYEYFYNHYLEMVMMGRQGLLSWSDLDKDSTFKYDNMKYNLKEFEKMFENIIKETSYV